MDSNKSYKFKYHSLAFLIKIVKYTVLVTSLNIQSGFAQTPSIDTFQLEKEEIGKVQMDTFDIIWEDKPDYKFIEELEWWDEDERITCRIQDARGTLWIGTNKRLIKYSGQELKIYGLKDGLCSSHIHTIYEDNHIIWIGTENGISKLEKGVMECLENKTSESITSIQKANNGSIYFLHHNCPIIFHKSKKWKKIAPFKGTWVGHFTIDTLNCLWITTGEGLFFLKEKEWEEFCFNYQSDYLEMELQDSSKMFWFSFRYKNGTYKTIELNPYTKIFKKYNLKIIGGFQKIYKNKQEEIFIESRKDSLYQVKDNSNIIHLGHIDRKSTSISYYGVPEIKDRGGTIFDFNNHKPKYYTSDKQHYFKLTSFDYKKKTKFDLNFRLLKIDEKDIFWGYVRPLMLCKISNNKLIVYSFDNINFRLQDLANLIILDHDKFIFTDRVNDFFKVEDNKVFKVKRKHHKSSPNQYFSIATENNFIWFDEKSMISCSDECCLRIPYKEQLFIEFYKNLLLGDFKTMMIRRNKYSTFSEKIIKKDKFGNIWFFKFDSGGNACFLEKDSISSLKKGDILHPSGSLSISKHDKLKEITYNSFSFPYSHHFNNNQYWFLGEKEEVYELNFIDTINFDKYNIKDFNPEKKLFYHNGEKIELPLTIATDKNNHLWLDAHYHKKIDMIKYNPNFKDTIAPLIHIKDINLFNRSINWFDTLGLEKRKIAFNEWDRHFYVPDELSLPYDENTISFQVLGVHLRSPKKVRYQYRLLESGVSTDTIWSTIATDGNITYSKLPPSTFKFEARACNADSLWSKPVSYTFVIRPPWWQTTWFISCTILGIILGTILLYRQWERAKVRIRENALTNLGQDFHDDNRNTVYSMQNIISEASNYTHQPTIIEQYLDKLSNYTIQINHDMGIFIKSLSIKKTNLRDTMSIIQANAINSIFRFGLPKLRVEGMLEVEPFFIAKELNGSVSREIQLIFKEAMTNAKKYSQSNNVWLTMEVRGNKAILCFKDDGVGFDRTQIREGNGLVNLEKRATKINAKLCIKSEINQGTTITLELDLDQNTFFNNLYKFLKNGQK